jgi:hypothetical protein
MSRKWLHQAWGGNASQPSHWRRKVRWKSGVQKTKKQNHSGPNKNHMSMWSAFEAESGWSETCMKRSLCNQGELSTEKDGRHRLFGWCSTSVQGETRLVGLYGKKTNTCMAKNYIYIYIERWPKHNDVVKWQWGFMLVESTVGSRF